jgi:hypothetical protein
MLSTEEIISSQHSAVLWYERSPSARISSGFLPKIFFKVFLESSLHPQSPTAATLNKLEYVYWGIIGSKDKPI